MSPVAHVSRDRSPPFTIVSATDSDPPAPELPMSVALCSSIRVPILLRKLVSTTLVLQERASQVGRGDTRAIGRGTGGSTDPEPRNCCSGGFNCSENSPTNMLVVETCSPYAISCCCVCSWPLRRSWANGSHVPPSSSLDAKEVIVNPQTIRWSRRASIVDHRGWVAHENGKHAFEVGQLFVENQFVGAALSLPFSEWCHSPQVPMNPASSAKIRSRFFRRMGAS